MFPVVVEGEEEDALLLLRAQTTGAACRTHISTCFY
jgi:phosphoribosyl-AMP cyclohydrolase